MTIWKKSKLDLLLSLALVGIVLVFLNRGVRMEGIFFGADEIASDLLHFAYPYHEYWANEYLKHGQIPLWNSYLSSGVPILAEAQTGIFYLPAVILYLLLPTAVAFNWLIIVCFIAVVLGTYLFARQLGLPRTEAFFSAIVFTLSGFMVGHLRHLPMITAVALMPWMFLIAEKILSSPKFGWTAVLAVLIALSFFAGHLSTTYYILLILSIYFLFRLKAHFDQFGQENLRPLIFFLLAYFLGVTLAAVQLLPALELISYSTRASTDFSGLLSARFELRFLLLFLSPYLFGDPSVGTWDMDQANFWENASYIGIVPLVLSLLGLSVGLGRSKAYRGTIRGCLILTLILALGALTPLYRWFWEWIPGFSFTRISGRFLLFVDFFLVLAAGFGLLWLRQASQIWWPQMKKGQGLLIWGVIIFSLADLFYFWYPFNTVMPLSYLQAPESVQFLLKDPNLFRVRTIDWTSWKIAWQNAKGWRGDLTPYLREREFLPPDSNLLYRLPSTSIIYALVGHYSVKRPEELDYLTLTNAAVEGTPDRFAKLLGMENVKYLVSSYPLPEVLKGLELVWTVPDHEDGEKIYIYHNNFWLPRAYFVSQVKTIDDPKLVLKTMAEGDFDPSKEVILEKPVDFLPGEERGQVEIISYQDSRVEIKVQNDKPGFLVLADTAYPGWQVRVNGRKTEIFTANYAYRAIFLPPGEHQVIFSFEPLSVKIGGVVSLVSVFALLMIVWLPDKFKLRPKWTIRI